MENPTNSVGFSDSLETCPLCFERAVLEQDHDHRTDLCRGRICHSCNLLVARYDRPLAEIARFLDYLTQWDTAHAVAGGQTYTDYMRELSPRYGKRGPGRWQRRTA